MNKKMKTALMAYVRAIGHARTMKRRYYPPGRRIEVKGYGTAIILNQSSYLPPDQLYVQLTGGHYVNVFLSDILPSKKVEVTK